MKDMRFEGRRASDSPPGTWVGVVVAFMLIALAGAVLLYRTSASAEERAGDAGADRVAMVVGDRGILTDGERSAAALLHVVEQVDSVALSLE